jgi:hypothetical protein
VPTAFRKKGGVSRPERGGSLKEEGLNILTNSFLLAAPFFFSTHSLSPSSLLLLSLASPSSFPGLFLSLPVPLSSFSLSITYSLSLYLENRIPLICYLGDHSESHSSSSSLHNLIPGDPRYSHLSQLLSPPLLLSLPLSHSLSHSPSLSHIKYHAQTAISSLQELHAQIDVL